MNKTTTDKMANLLAEKALMEDCEKSIQQKKKKIAELALEIETLVGADCVGNILYEGKYYQIRKRKDSYYICGPRNEPFGSWRKKKEDK